MRGRGLVRDPFGASWLSSQLHADVSLASVRQESVTGLYWSNSGDVLCLEHARGIGAPRWQEEEWKPLPAASQHWTKGWRYQCQRCSPDGRAVVHAVEPKCLVRRKATAGPLRGALSVFTLLALLQRLITSIGRRRKTV